jgi:transmembrane sensor
VDGGLITMTSQTPQQSRLAIEAEAAAWLARLNGGARTAATDQAYQAWLAADPAHVAAAERAQAIWEKLPGVGEMIEDQEPIHQPIHRPMRSRVPMIAALAAAAAIVVVIPFAAGHDVTYETRVGELRTINLSDGSRVSLNTGTRVVVDYRRGERRVRLEQGEAFFEVAKNPERPFLVTAGDETVRALGTAFLVKRSGEDVAVTLVEGKVEVRAQGARKVLSKAVLTPGQRLTVQHENGLAYDRPAIEAVTAWRRGEAVFDNATLLSAAAELNRYGMNRVVVADPEVGSLRISGVFSTRDPAEFAAVASQVHGLKVDKNANGVIVLKRPG